MKPRPFAYHDPTTVAETVDLLATLDDVTVLAGGQSLMPMMNMRLAGPEHLVDVNGVGEMAGIELSGGVLEIGAVTRQRACERSREVAGACPLLAEALPHVGHVQTRSRGTIGGSLAHLDPAAELPAVTAALDGEIVAAGRAGIRTIPMRDFARTYFTSTLEPGEVLRAVRLPVWPPGHGYAFEEFARRHGDFAVVGVAALVQLDGGGRVARVAVALAGMGPTPVRAGEVEAALAGEVPSADLLRASADRARACEAVADIHGTAEYRQHLAAVLTGRALDRACRRARGGADGG